MHLKDDRFPQLEVNPPAGYVLSRVVVSAPLSPFPSRMDPIIFINKSHGTYQQKYCSVFSHVVMLNCVSMTTYHTCPAHGLRTMPPMSGKV